MLLYVKNNEDKMDIRNNFFKEFNDVLISDKSLTGLFRTDYEQKESHYSLCYLSELNVNMDKIFIKKMIDVYQEEDQISEKEKNKIIKIIKNMNSKHFGEMFEHFIIYKEKFKKSKNKYYDLIQDGLKFEVKASRVFNQRIKNKEETYYKYFMNEDTTGLISFKDFVYSTPKIKNNIQQVKPNENDTICYFLFFDDCILSFKMDPFLLLDLNEGVNQEFLTSFDKYIKRKISYSNKQHKGNLNEGQFCINENNLFFHIFFFLDNVYSFNDFYSFIKEYKE